MHLLFCCIRDSIDIMLYGVLNYKKDFYETTVPRLECRHPLHDGPPA